MSSPPPLIACTNFPINSSSLIPPVLHPIPAIRDGSDETATSHSPPLEQTTQLPDKASQIIPGESHSLVLGFPTNSQEQNSSILEFPTNNHEQLPYVSGFPKNNIEWYSSGQRFHVNNLEQQSSGPRFPVNNLEQQSSVPRFPVNNLKQSSVPRFPVNNLKQSSVPRFPVNNLKQSSVPRFPVNNLKQSSVPRFPVNNLKQSSVPRFPVNNLKQSSVPRFPVNNLKQSSVPRFPVNNLKQSSVPRFPVNNLKQSSVPKFLVNNLKQSSVPRLPLNSLEQNPGIPRFPLINQDQYPWVPGFSVTNLEQEPDLLGFPMNNQEQHSRLPEYSMNNQYSGAPDFPVNSQEQYPSMRGFPLANQEQCQRLPGYPMNNLEQQPGTPGFPTNSQEQYPDQQAFQVTNPLPSETRASSSSFSLPVEFPGNSQSGQSVQNIVKNTKRETETTPVEVPAVEQRSPEVSGKVPTSSENSPEKPEEKPTLFWCDFCNRPFRKKSGLAKHMLNHITDKPHQCDVCDKEFTYRSPWIYHMKKVHNYVIFTSKSNRMKPDLGHTNQHNSHSDYSVNNQQNGHRNLDQNNQQNSHRDQDQNNQQNSHRDKDQNNQQNSHRDKDQNNQQNSHRDQDQNNQQNSHRDPDQNNQQNSHRDQDQNNQQNSHRDHDQNNQQNSHRDQDQGNQQNSHRDQDQNNQQHSHRDQDKNNQQKRHCNGHSDHHLNKKKDDNHQQDNQSNQDINNNQNGHCHQDINRQEDSISNSNCQQTGNITHQVTNLQIDCLSQSNSHKLSSVIGKRFSSSRNIGQHRKYKKGFPGRKHKKGFPGRKSKKGFPGRKSKKGFPGRKSKKGFPGRNYRKGFPFALTSLKLFGEYPRPYAVCKKLFKTESNLVRHVMLTHQNRKQNRHAQWRKESKRISSNFYRLKRHHRCSKCKKTFLFESNLLRHLRIHDDKPLTDRLYDVNDGTPSKSRSDQDNNHSIPSGQNKNVHSDRKESLQCDVCDETFNQESKSNAPAEKSHSVSVNKGETDRGVDGKFKTTKEPVFSTNNDDDRKKIQCEMGNILFKYNNHRNHHRRAAHSADNILQCVHCGKNFIDKNNYQNHVMAHVIRGRPAKPDVTTHGTPEGAAVRLDGVAMTSAANGCHGNGFTVGDDQYFNAVQPFPTLHGISEFLQPISYGESTSSGTNSRSAAQDIPPAGKQLREKESEHLKEVPMATHPPMEQSPHLAEVTIEYQRQKEKMTEAETGVRGQHVELNRKQGEEGNDVIPPLQHGQGRGDESYENNEISSFDCNLYRREITQEMDLTAEREILHNIQCTRCGEEFNDSSNFIKHVISDCEDGVVTDVDTVNVHKQSYCEKTFQCSMCGEGFRTESLLRDHMKAYHTGITHRCTECDETFMTSWVFALHKQQHEEQIEYSRCETSDGILNHQWGLENYVQNMEERRYQCSFCDASFAQNIALIQHELEHEPEVTHQCTMCGKVFRGRLTCELHMRTHHGGALRIQTNFHCTVCGESFRDETECVDHMKNCCNKKEEVSECAECGAVFLQQSWLEEHKNSVHTKNRDFQCKMCEKIFVTEDNLEHHTQMEHNASFQCDQCDKSFIRKTSYDLHKRNHALAERLGDPSLKLSLNHHTFKDGCPSISDAERQTGEDRQQCETCGESFTQELSLNTHVLTHCVTPSATEQPVLATHSAPEVRHAINDRAFNSEGQQHPSFLAIPLILERKDSKCFPWKKFSALKTRKFNRRQNGRFYQCDDCKKSFRQKSNLARHLQMNNTENHHRCGRCKKSFYTTMKYCKH